MKKLLLLPFAALCLSAINATAQSVPLKADVGIKAGANFAQIGGDHWEKTYQPGVLFGATLGVRKEKFGVQAEFQVNTSHYTTKDLVDSVRKGDFRATYFDIPVMVEYRILGGKLLPKVWIMAGPQFSGLMSVKSLNDFAGDAKSTFKTGYFAGVAGLEVRFMKFTVGGRYVMGLTSINNQSASTIKESWNARTAQLYLGFRFI